MAKARLVKARKDYPQFGIEKGDEHWVWELKTGPRSSRTYRQKDKPLPEQLTTSEYLQQWYPLNREIADFDGSADELQEIIDRLAQLRDETQEKLDAMPDGLRDSSPTGELLQERVEECESLHSDLESHKSDLEAAEEAVDDAQNAVDNHDGDGEDSLDDLQDDLTAAETERQTIIDAINAAAQ